MSSSFLCLFLNFTLLPQILLRLSSLKLRGSSTRSSSHTPSSHPLLLLHLYYYPIIPSVVAFFYRHSPFSPCLFGELSFSSLSSSSACCSLSSLSCLSFSLPLFLPSSYPEFLDPIPTPAPLDYLSRKPKRVRPGLCSQSVRRCTSRQMVLTLG